MMAKSKTLVFVLLLSSVTPVHANSKQISGWIEHIAITQKNFILTAKIDSGAIHSSIHSESYQIFKKNGVEWVRFSLNNKSGGTMVIEEPLYRMTNVKLRENESSQKRPVVKLGICLGNIYKVVEVNIVNRAKFNYPVLIGRSFLAGQYLVDVELKHLTKPSCHTK